MATLGYSWTTIKSGSYSLSGATLTYYIEAKLNSQSTSENKSYVSTRASTTLSGSMSSYNVHMSCTGCTSYNGDNFTIYYFSTSTGVLTGSTTVSHNADGTGTLSMSGACTGNLGMNIDLSGSISLPKIARSSKPTTNKTTLTLNGSDTIVVSTNRASSSFTHTLTFTANGNTATVNNVGASYTWTPQVATWMPYMSSWEQTVTVQCITYSGSTQIGSAQTCTFKLQVDTSTYSAKNIVIQLEHASSDPTTALSGTSYYIKGYAIPRFIVSCSITSDYNYALASAALIYDGATYITELSGNTANFTLTASKAVGTTAKIRITDNHGYSVEQNVTLPIKDYSPITITSVDIQRVNAGGVESETGDCIAYTINCSVFKGSLGAVDNAVEIYYKYKTPSTDYTNYVLHQTITPQGESIYGDSTLTGTIGNELDDPTFTASSQFNIQLKVIDKITNAESIVVIVHEGVPVLAWGENHVDVYGELHTHDRTEITEYITYGISSTDTRTSEQFVAFGYVTTSGQDAYIFIPMTLLPVDPQITYLYVSMRSGNGYLGGTSVDITSDIVSATPLKNQGLLQIFAQRSGGWSVTNNTPIIGTVTLSYTYTE